jgi:hypothetical protein
VVEGWTRFDITNNIRICPANFFITSPFEHLSLKLLASLHTYYTNPPT